MALVRAARKTSSSYTCRYCRHHVFLSFRGQDTRKTFTDHLYTALVNAGFRTFRDDDEVQRGEGIKPELQKAIKHSRTSVIVFSKDYASSTWCLEELVMILERKRISADHVVLPVFYDVDPSDVRKQTGSLAKAFARHQRSQPSNKVKEWREALAEVADLAGMVLQNQADGHESKFINKIVQVIGEKLRRRPLSVPHRMIGMHSRVNELNLWLQDGSDDVGILVIYGMSGIGKTTIAKSVYNTNFERFEGSSFIENIREISQQPNGLVQIQIQLLYDILIGRKVKIHCVSEGMTEIEDAISSKRVFLVLDDVDHISQLDVVLGMKDQFYPGSKIIITTRRARLLKVHQVTKVHTVQTLDNKESLELLSWHAFGRDHPIEDYIEYSKKLVDHCGGLPLALQVLGSSLLGESIGVWKSALEKLKAIPNGEIVNKLRVSYDSLQDDHDRKLFLHIACFFIGKDKDYIVKILDGCDFYTIVGIQNLIDRCLVTIDEFDKVHMHDLICGMGREIVHQESEEPWKRSRVWHHKDSFKILSENNGTRAIEGLVFDMHMLLTNILINSNEIVLETNAFAKMRELKLLHLSHVQLNGSYAEFCTGLRWLCWTKFPLDSIPTEFSLRSLVVLEMRYSSLRQVCKGTKCLRSLKILDLSHSHSLTETTDFSFCPNLEKLILVDCVSLIYVHGSIGNLERLVYLNTKDCKNLKMLPENICMLKLLETLIISGCTSLNELSIEMLRNIESLKVLHTDGILIGELVRGRSSCILSCLTCSLVDLSLQGCNLSNDAFPREFSNLSSLRRLNIGDNPICSLPNCIKGLTRLDKLSFSGCKTLKLLEGLPRVGTLDVADCISLEKITYERRPRRIDAILWNNCNLVEWQYRYKLEPVGSVDAEIINLLGLSNLESMAPIRMRKRNWMSAKDVWNPVQGLYEKGIFSTFFAGNEVPGQFSHKSTKSPISFTVPLLDNHRIQGLKVFVVYTKLYANYSVRGALPGAIITRVKNKSKGLKWIYCPRCYGIPGEGEDMIWLSLWKLEEQVHLEGGDEVVVSVIMQPWLQVKEFGIQLVQQLQQENHNMMTVSTDASYYPRVKSGDLYQYQPGVYLLFSRIKIEDPIWFNKILEDSDDEDTTVKESHRNPWRGISKGYTSFLHCCRFSVGNGEKIRFWEDNWRKEGTLQVLFPRLFSLSRKKNLKISEFVNNSVTPHLWDFNFRRNLTEAESTEEVNLLVILEEVRVIGTRVDKRLWELEDHGSFSCKSFRTFLLSIDSRVAFTPFSPIWKAKSPPKVKFLVWLIALGKINTCDLIQRRHPMMCLSPSWCVLCRESAESIDHLFLHCPFSLNLWWNLLRAFGVFWVTPRGCEDLLSIKWAVSGNRERALTLWNCLTHAIYWNVWMERNRRIFQENKGASFEEVWERVKFWASIWASVSGHFNDYHYSIIMRDLVAVLT